MKLNKKQIAAYKRSRVWKIMQLWENQLGRIPTSLDVASMLKRAFRRK